MALLRTIVVLVVSVSLSIAAHAQVIVPIGSGFFAPEWMTLDSAGNVLVSDSSSPGIKRILVAGGYTTVETLGSGISNLRLGLDVDSNDNVIVAEVVSGEASSPFVIRRILAAGGYTTVETLLEAGDVAEVPAGLALDSAGNIVFNTLALLQDHLVRRVLAAGGYVTFETLGSGFDELGQIALDTSDNVYVTDVAANSVHRLLASDGYATVETLGSGFAQPVGVAVGGNGDVYVTEGGGAVKKIEAAGGYTNVTTILTLPNFGFDLTVDSAGDLYVTERDGNRVIKILMSVVPTTTSIASNINPSVFRQTVAFTATVAGNNPTGTVNVFAGPNLLCGAPLPAGSNQVSCSFTGLLAMSHSITAVYSGDAVNYTSTSAPLTQVVNQAATTSTVSAPGPITFGQSVIVTATVAVTAPGGGTPTGVIAVSDGSVSCNIVLPNTSCSLTPTSIGPRTVTASYGGDANYVASSNTTPLSVVAPATTTTLTSSINPSVFGQSVTYTATVAGSSPTGTVDFFDGATPLCSSVALAAAQAACSTTMLTAGAHSITAVYGGDGNNAASTSVPLAQNVDQATTVTSVTAPGPITLGESVVVMATVAVSAPGGGTPTGTIGISDGIVSCSIVLPASGCSLTPTTVGARTITASYDGDANFVASSSTASLSVAPSVTGIVVASDINPSVAGQGVTFTATVTGNSPTGTVDFLDGAVPLCSGVALAAAQATCSSAALSVGAHSITAVYGGDVNNDASTSSAVAQSVSAASTLTSVSAPGPITLGDAVLVTATVAVTAPGAGTPTGTIGIIDGAATCSIVLPATTCSLTPTSGGSRTITASYSGDGSFAASSATVTLTVNASTQTISVVAPGAVRLNDSPVSITVSASSGLPVTLTSDTLDVCSVSGTGPFTLTLLTAGLCTLTASQAGDVDNAPASAVINLQVAGASVGEVRVVPTLDRWSLLGAILLLGTIGLLRARRV